MAMRNFERKQTSQSPLSSRSELLNDNAILFLLSLRFTVLIMGIVSSLTCNWGIVENSV